jgi:hypothetical protein
MTVPTIIVMVLMVVAIIMTVLPTIIATVITTRTVGRATPPPPTERRPRPPRCRAAPG